MSETGDFELFSAPAAKEHDEKSDEKFREEMKRSQVARQQLQKEEGKAKAHDNKLAQIIVQFLAQANGTELFLLISRCVAQNIPSELIIAVLSLIDRKASEEVDHLLKEAQSDSNLPIPQHAAMHDLNSAQKNAIDEWINHISAVAAHKPQDTLESALLKRVNKNTQEIIHEISPSLIQLSAFIMRNYLAMQNTQIEFQKLHDFIQEVYVRLLQSLEEMLKGQKQLKGSEAQS